VFLEISSLRTSPLSSSSRARLFLLLAHFFYLCETGRSGVVSLRDSPPICPPSPPRPGSPSLLSVRRKPKARNRAESHRVRPLRAVFFLFGLSFLVLLFLERPSFFLYLSQNCLFNTPKGGVPPPPPHHQLPPVVVFFLLTILIRYTSWTVK